MAQWASSNVRNRAIGKDSMQKKRILLTFSISVAFLALAGTGCSTVTIPLYTAGLSKEAKTVESQGLTIAVDPVLDSERADTYFKVNPAGKGIGIIYLQAENKSVNATWLLDEKNMHLTIAGQAGDMNAEDQYVKGDYGKAYAYTAGAVICSGALLGAVFIVAANQATENASIIQKNFVDKEWHNQTLAPGQQVAGFIYFNLGKNSRWAGSSTLRIDCINLRNYQTNTITFPLTYETK
jgi:hypothetical protein